MYYHPNYVEVDTRTRYFLGCVSQTGRFVVSCGLRYGYAIRFLGARARGLRGGLARLADG